MATRRRCWRQPAVVLHAVAPLYDDYDAPVDLVMPGGLFAEGFIADWGAANHALDHNDYCALTGARGVGCFIQKQFVRGIKPVDADRGGHLLDSIVRARSNYDVLREMQQLENPRDTFPTSKLSFDAISPFGMRAKVESLATPMLVRVGWLDAGTVNVALGRFQRCARRNNWRSGRGATAADIMSIRSFLTARPRTRRAKPKSRRC